MSSEILKAERGAVALLGWAACTGVTGHYSAKQNRCHLAGLDYQWTDKFDDLRAGVHGIQRAAASTPGRSSRSRRCLSQPETVTTLRVWHQELSGSHNTRRCNWDGHHSRYNDIQLTLLNCGFLTPAGFSHSRLPLPLCALPYNTGNADIKGRRARSARRNLWAGLRSMLMEAYLTSITQSL